MEKPFRKDLTHLTWTEVYARQEKRAHLVPEWMEALRLKPGDRVLEAGAGPGFVSLILADRVGPEGIVYAVDKSTEALALLAQRQAERGLPQIRPIAADLARLAPLDPPAQSALITMVLHHSDDPTGILRGVARLLSPGALVLVGEFHPAGPCEQGPPADHRIDPEILREWCESAGLVVMAYRRQSPEHYMVLTRQA
jgi:ubiquinone/menaquinone biosynthesis C-methylase UbiE